MSTTEQYLEHHTLLRRLLGTASYLHMALGVVNQVFRFRRYELPRIATFVMRGSLREAMLQMIATPCHVALSLSVPVHTPLLILLYAAQYRVRNAASSHRRGGAGQGKIRCHAAEARLCAC